MIPKPEHGKPVKEEVLGGDAADQVAPGGGRGNPHVRGRGRDVEEGRDVGAPTGDGVGKGILFACFYQFRFSFKRFGLDLLVGLFFNLFWWVGRDAWDGPLEIREIIPSTQIMLFFFYWVEDFKDAPLTAAIQTTLLVVPWAICTSLVWAYYHSDCALFAIAMQHVFTALVMYINFYVSVVMPVDEERRKNMGKFPIQSAISIPLWATFFYLVGMGKMVEFIY